MTDEEPGPADDAPPLALTMGDPAGIGGEIAARAWASGAVARPFFLIGDPAWAELVSITVHRRDADPLHAQPVADGVEVAVGLSRMGVASVLSAFEHGEPPMVGPAPWQETLASFLGAHVGAQGASCSWGSVVVYPGLPVVSSM